MVSLSAYKAGGPGFDSRWVTTLERSAALLCGVLSMVGCTIKIPVVFRKEKGIAPGNGLKIWEKRAVMKVIVFEL